MELPVPPKRIFVLFPFVIVVCVLVVAGLALRQVGVAGTCALSASRVGHFIDVPAGSFVMSAHPKYLEEPKPRRVYVKGFQLQVTEVTNDQFARFVASTGYRTSAERKGGSAVFSPTRAAKSGAQYPMSWWRLDKHATWRAPEGQGSHLKGRGRHPVVHVSLEDARAYARWAKARLPTEAEWEYAATLGLFDKNAPDSGAIGPKGESLANIWDGDFPKNNTRKFMDRCRGDTDP